MMWWLLVELILLLILFIILLFFNLHYLYGAPYEPSRGKALKNIVKFTNPKKGDKIAELGSGDGRICIELAKKGAEVHGFEINPFLVFISRKKIKKAKLQNKIFIHWKNFFKEDLRGYNKIVLFQFNTITKKISKKLKKELKPKSKIISHWWQLKEFKLKKKIGRIYLYEV